MEEKFEYQIKERAVLVGLNADCFTQAQTATDETLEELEALLETAGGFCTAKILQNKHTPDPHSFIGEGKAQEVRMLVEATNSTMVVFDNELSPSNIRALEEIMGVTVLDRSALILDIFAQRAKTKEGRLQVELAQYKYLLPRLSGMGKSLSRQGGGIGTRGPGETKLESDRRHIRERISRLQSELEQVRQVRGVQRERRMKNSVPVVAIVGYTNAGKSTLLNQLAGLEKPTKGSVVINGENISKMDEKKLAVFRQNNIGFIFQAYNLMPTMTAVENVAFPLMFQGVKKSVREKKARAILREMQLKDRMNHKPTELSGGQQQRVGIARAFVGQPSVIFADEPTGNLDSKTTEQVMDMLMEISEKNNITFVMVTHDPELAKKAKRVVYCFLYLKKLSCPMARKGAYNGRK